MCVRACVRVCVCVCVCVYVYIYIGAPIVLGGAALEALRRNKAHPLIYTGYRPSGAPVPPAGGGGEMEILDDDDDG